MAKFNEVKAEFLNVLKFLDLDQPEIVESQVTKITANKIEIQAFQDLESFEQSYAIFGHWISILYSESNNDIKNKVVKSISKLCSYSIPLLEEMEENNAII